MKNISDSALNETYINQAENYVRELVERNPAWTVHDAAAVLQAAIKLQQTAEIVESMRTLSADIKHSIDIGFDRLC